jgi:glycosyltransferase involved in cell wall biosynthesis
MKIVYVGPLDEGGTCYSRLVALRDIEPDIHPFDIRPYFQKTNTLNKFANMTFIGLQFASVNRNFIAFCSGVKPNVVWVDKGYWIWPSSLKNLRSQGIFLVQHNTDALHPASRIMRWQYTLIRQTLRYYDLYFTSNLRDFATLSVQSIPRTELTFLGYDHLRFNNLPLPIDLTDRWASDLLFIGHYEPRTERRISALVEAGLQVRVYGSGWERARNRNNLRGYVHFRQLSNKEYIHALKAAKIGLCFVSELNGNQTAGRSFEIPACGTFLLAVRTPQHRECYVEGKEAEFFEDHRELVEKARFYLEHEDQRQEIARCGNQRCVMSDYSWARYMRQDWTKVLKHIRGQ